MNDSQKSVNPSPTSESNVLAKVGNVISLVTGPLTRQNAISWIGLIALVLIIRWVVFEPFTIPSGSMEPTLHGDPRMFRGDRIAVNKFIYGPRVPFMNKRLFRLAEPKRWDIVVFKAVDPNAQHGTLVKRIVGLPGERIHIQNGRIHVAGKALELPKAMPPIRYTSGPGDFDSFNQRIAMGRAASAEALRNSPFRYGILPDDEYSVVPKDCYLVLGDNSANSADGRIFGWVPNDHLVGRAFCIWWPMARWHDFTGFSHTWWGKGILFGIPLALVLYELLGYVRRRAQRVSDSE